MGEAKTKGKRNAGTTDTTDDFPPPTILTVRVSRDVGEGDARTVEWDDDVEVSIDEMCVGQFGDVMEALGPALQAITVTPDLATLLVTYRNEILAAIGIAIGWPTERVARMDIPSLVNVTFHLVERHLGTFKRSTEMFAHFAAFTQKLGAAAT